MLRADLGHRLHQRVVLGVAAAAGVGLLALVARVVPARPPIDEAPLRRLEPQPAIHAIGAGAAEGQGVQGQGHEDQDEHEAHQRCEEANGALWGQGPADRPSARPGSTGVRAPTSGCAGRPHVARRHARPAAPPRSPRLAVTGHRPAQGGVHGRTAHDAPDGIARLGDGVATEQVEAQEVEGQQARIPQTALRRDEEAHREGGNHQHEPDAGSAPASHGEHGAHDGEHPEPAIVGRHQVDPVVGELLPAHVVEVGTPQEEGQYPEAGDQRAHGRHRGRPHELRTARPQEQPDHGAHDGEDGRDQVAQDAEAEQGRQRGRRWRPVSRPRATTPR